MRFPWGDLAIPQRIYPLLLGCGHLVDPLLFILGFWRHIYKRFPLVYDPQYWGMVFPLGMYTVCTFQLSGAINFEPLLIIPRFFVFIALAAWLTFVGLIHNLVPWKAKPLPVVSNV